MNIVENRADLGSDALSVLASALRSHSSMKHALDWLQAHEPPFTLTDIVTHDEFSHDILVAYRDGLWLVYDST